MVKENLTLQNKEVKQETEQSDAEALQQDQIDFSINPATVNVEKGKTASFTITGDVDSIVSESLATSIFTVADKTITGVAKGTGKLKIIATKAGKQDTEKQFDVNCTEPAPVDPNARPEELTNRLFGKFKKE